MTKVLNISLLPFEKATPSVEFAAQMIQQGGLVVYPTDTIYGIGCDPFNEKALKRLIVVKGRDASKGMPVLASSINEVQKVADINDQFNRIINVVWPGQVTLIMPAKSKISNLVTGGRRSIAVRIPDHWVALALIKASGGVLIGTSANLSGSLPPLELEGLNEQLGDHVDLILWSGYSGDGLPSTLIDLTVDPPQILRRGIIDNHKLTQLFI